YDYLTKPFDLEQVAALITRAMELRRLTRDLERLRGELEQRHDLVIGRTPAMQEVYKVIGRVAPTDATVLIQGETGTGKELIAKTIHQHSSRGGPFMALNCSAIPNELLEAAVRAGRFREDLYFRLNVVRITVPPLRERRADVPELIEFFLGKVNRELGTALVGVSAEVRDLLLRHSWPGNVRELENA